MAVNAKQTIMIKKYINIWLTYECNLVAPALDITEKE